MLRHLFISNYALIDKLDISLDDGLTIITGETGAGKSILLGALSLLMGSRADAKAIRRADKKTVVEATFQVPETLKGWFVSNDLDYNAETLMRREISVAGRSRAFVNDTPVNLTQLEQLTSSLIDIHSQYETANLRNQNWQLALIDAFSGIEAERGDYDSCFRSFVESRKKAENIKKNYSENEEQSKRLAAQLADLDEIAPQRGELARLERTFDILGDATEIKERLMHAVSILGDSEEGGIVAGLHDLRGIVERLNPDIFDAGDNILERIVTLGVEAKDILELMERKSAGIETDPMALQKIEERMRVLLGAVKRHGVQDCDALVDLHHSLRRRMDALAVSPDDVRAAKQEMHLNAQRLRKSADALTAARRKGADEFAARLNEEARPLGLPNLQFSVGMERKKLMKEGQDEITFLCAFNKNQEAMPLGRVASGGEASRLMLAIKSIMAGRHQMPTIIFDEVDTGVSGEIADRMGRMMQEMSQRVQVIAITHLPQVASKGKMHLKVFKKDEDTKTVTALKELSAEERVGEIARMLSGATVQEAAIDNARQLLRNN